MSKLDIEGAISEVTPSDMVDFAFKRNIKEHGTRLFKQNISAVDWNVLRVDQKEVLARIGPEPVLVNTILNNLQSFPGNGHILIVLPLILDQLVAKGAISEITPNK